MASASTICLMLLALTTFMVAEAIDNPCTTGLCVGLNLTCPPGCVDGCRVNCRNCHTNCGCNRRGAVCQDPRFVGGDGTTFYFHGKKDEDFCLVSDKSLHINAHFIGKEGGAGRKRDFTWVESLGILFGSHKLYLGANKASTWDDEVDQLSIIFDSTLVHINQTIGASWKDQLAGISMTRNSPTNTISLEIHDLLSIDVSVVPITKEESRVHNYGITDEDCFAHLDLHFKFYQLSHDVHGVLGHTYAPEFVSPIKRNVAMPVFGGENLFATSSLMAPDCKVSRFGGEDNDEELKEYPSQFPAIECSGLSSGRGIVCRR